MAAPGVKRHSRRQLAYPGRAGRKEGQGDRAERRKCPLLRGDGVLRPLSNDAARRLPTIELNTRSRFSRALPVHLTKRLWFPDPRTAQRGGAHDGLVAVGADLSAARLLLAYRNGLFPWTDEPVTWWSPDPRAIFELDHFHTSESLAHVIRNGVFEITTNRAFRQVMEGCTGP